MGSKWVYKVLLLAVVFWQAAVPLWAGAADPTLKVYHEKSGQFSLPFPATWTTQENSVIQGYKIPFIALRPLSGANETFQDNLNVTLEPIPASMKTGDYLVANLKAISQGLKGFKMLKMGSLKGGYPDAQYMVYTHQSAPAPVNPKVVSYFYTKDSVGYVLTCSATRESFEKYSGLFEQVAKGFVPGK